MLLNPHRSKNTFKQNTITFKVFVLWLRNQHYYTHNAIEIKMKYRDLPYYKASGHCEYNLNENKHENHTNCLHTCTFRKWTITWSLFVLSSHTKCWLIHHSMVFTAIYSSHDSDAIKNGRPTLDCTSVKKTSRRSSLLRTK